MFGPIPYGSVQRSSVNVLVEIVKNGYIVRYSLIKKKPPKKDEDEIAFRREDIIEETIILQNEEDVINLFRQLKEQLF